METERKPKIVFAFVEAGLGHIMPMKAIADAFESKYGDRAEIIRTYFYQDKNNPDMKYVEDELIREVKLHNKRKMQGFLHFALLRIFGTRLSMSVLMKKRYKRGFAPSVDYLKELDADIIVNTHFSTLFCACEAKSKGLINSKVIAYCPDPHIGLQWDNRVDLIGLSSKSGKETAEKRKCFRSSTVVDVPFLIRKEMEKYNKGKQFYRRELGLPQDNFTILLADGAYGAGKLKKTVYELFKQAGKKNERLEALGEITVCAVCGKNETLFNEFKSLVPPENIKFYPYGFTDKTIALAASCDLFIGKAGASNLAEPTYFGVPSIITFRATPVEKWISAHFEKSGCAVRIENIPKAVKNALQFVKNPKLMSKYQDACIPHHRCDGPEQFADIIWKEINK